MLSCYKHNVKRRFVQQIYMHLSTFKKNNQCETRNNGIRNKQSMLRIGNRLRTIEYELKLYEERKI